MSDITIVASGWSAKPVVKRLGGTIIAVNGAATALYRTTETHISYALTMDRLFMEQNYQALFLGVMGDSPAGEVWARRSAIQNFTDLGVFQPYLKVFDCDNETTVFSTKMTHLNGTNSGGCAMNLAYLLRPSRLFMVGFDMNRDENGNPYWHEPHAWTNPKGATTDGKYRQWAKEFRSIMDPFKRIHCEVFNVSPTSSIDAFQKISAREYFKLVGT